MTHRLHRAPRRTGGRFPIVVALLLAASCAATLAQDDVSVRAFLQPASGFNDANPIRLVIQVQGSSSAQVVPPRLPKLTNLTVLNGPNTQTNISWINGRTSATYELSYTLMADAAGPAEIPALEVSVDGRVYRTEPFRLEVTKAPTGPPAPGSSRGEGGEASSAADAAVFLQAKLGATEVWVGQPVPLNVTLYAQPRITGFNWRKQPDFANFWVETVDFDADAEATRTRINAQPYVAYPVDRRVLIPPGAGSYELEPYVGQIQVRLSPSDPFDWFRFGRAESILRRTEPLKLTVKPLPERGRPDDFSGAVGKYTLRAALDRDEARVDDAVALKATVRGEGALRSVGPPTLEAPVDLKVFDAQVKESSVRTQGGKIISSKTWEWIVVPMTPGEVRLPELRFAYFEPDKAVYEIATVGGLKLSVMRSEGAPDGTVARGGIQLQRRELAFIKPLRGSLQEGHARAHQGSVFRVLLLLPLGLAPLLAVLGRQRARLRQDRGLARGRKARARARKRLASVRRRIGLTDSATFHEEIARTLVEYLADRCNRSAAGLTYEGADQMLSERDIEPALRRRFRSCLETCDFVRFVPSATQTERREEVLAEASALVEELERAW